MDSEKPAAIRLSGDNILEEHCYFENTDGKVIIQCLPNSVTVRFACSKENSILIPLEVPQRKTNYRRTGDVSITSDISRNSLTVCAAI